MNEAEAQVQLYKERCALFMAQAQNWCGTHGLAVREITTELLERGLPDYHASGLHISTAEGQSIAELLPAGALILGGLGRIDVKGALARHVLLFHLESEPETATHSARRYKIPPGHPPRRRRSAIDAAGWYWHEAIIRRPKLVDEDLFLDLLTDVSDYEYL